MKCSFCDNKNKLRVETRNVKYDESGLSNITIENVKVYICDQCGEEYFEYGDLEKINQAIAETLLKKEDPLTGKELRFLRTLKGYNGKKFATFLNIKSETLYRAEAEESGINEKLDRAVRLAFLAIPDDNDYSDVVKFLFHENKGLKFKRIEISHNKSNYIAHAV